MIVSAIVLVIASAAEPGPGAKCPRAVREALANRAPCISNARHSCLTADMATVVATRFAAPRDIGQDARIRRVEYSCLADGCFWRFNYEPTGPRPVVGSSFSIVVNDTTCAARLIPGM